MAQLAPISSLTTSKGSTYCNMRIVIHKRYAKWKFIYHVLSCHNSIHRICLLLCIRWKKPNFSFFFLILKVRTYEFFPWNLPTTRCICSAAWCKRSLLSLLYDQTIEDINIFSPAFWLSWGGWLNLPHSPLCFKFQHTYFLFGHRADYDCALLKLGMMIQLNNLETIHLWKKESLKCIGLYQNMFDMQKGHSLEVDWTNVQGKGLIK